MLSTKEMKMVKEIMKKMPEKHTIKQPRNTLANTLT